MGVALAGAEVSSVSVGKTVGLRVTPLVLVSVGTLTVPFCDEIMELDPPLMVEDEVIGMDELCAVVVNMPEVDMLSAEVVIGVAVLSVSDAETALLLLPEPPVMENWSV